jgi:tetratricopeptide (TPR) repeat protein
MGKYKDSEIRILKLAEVKPNFANPKLLLLLLSCQAGQNRLDRNVDSLIGELNGVTYDPISVKTLKSLFDGVKTKPCSVLSMEQLGKITDRLIDSPSYQRISPVMGNLFFLRARINGYLGNDVQQALDLHESYRWLNLAYIAKAEAEAWAALGDYQKALEAIIKAKTNNYLNFYGFQRKIDTPEYDEWEEALTRAVKIKSN